MILRLPSPIFLPAIRRSTMTTIETAYLAMVLVAAGAFAATLLWASFRAG
jgi:hypothetical protein